MLVGIFKSNQRIISVFIIGLTILLWIPSLMLEASEVIPNRHFLFDFSPYLLKEIKWLGDLLFILMIGGQGIYINYIVNKYKLLKNETHLTALIFVVINTGLYSIEFLNPVIISNTFVLLVLHQLFRMYNLHSAYSLLFNVGLLISIACLVYFPIIVLFPLVWLVLMYTRKPVWRDFVISLMGFLLPFIFIAAYYYLADKKLELDFLEIQQPYFSLTGNDFLEENKIYFFVVGGIALYSVFSFFREMAHNITRIRKRLMVVLWLLGVVLFSLMLNSSDYSAVYLLITIPLSIIMTTLFQGIKKSWWAELLFLILLAGVVVNVFF